ncbi:PD-(D/E)XK nuclease family protein [Candidatus Gottesmanbacteria bacterium]|nr:PD-(D/E)XK nuclease family protein [Candidatus Gottesmanbacteria bacterium]
MKDKYSAVWVSHSSISDYLKCPRAYFLRNVYRDPKTNRKISVMEPPLALGQAVHDTIDTLSKLPVEARFTVPLMDTFETIWQNVTGLKGGFTDPEQEEKFKTRARDMITRVSTNPGPLKQKAIKIRQELPYYWLSEEDNIILCGKVDWLEYKQDSDSVRIIDFKTGKFDEDPDSLQLPIYYLLTSHTQTKPISGISYWYLDRDNEPIDMPLPDIESSEKKILDLAKKVALARKLGHFKCREDGCRACRPYESVLVGKATHVGINTYGQDLYILSQT